VQTNDLGGRQYHPDMEKVIYQTAVALKARDTSHFLKGLTPSQYMKYYVKAAGIIVECAMQLSVHTPGGASVKSFSSWMYSMTGLNITVVEDAQLEHQLLSQTKLIGDETCSS